MGLIAYFGFLQNFNGPHPNFFTEAWSLSIEEYAYIVGPLLLFILVSCFKRIPKNRLFLITVLGIIILVTCLRLNFHLSYNVQSMHEWSQEIRKVVIYRIDSIYYGFLAAFLIYNFNSFVMQFERALFWTGLVLFFGIHILIFGFDVQPESATFFYNIFYLPLLSITLLFMFPCLLTGINQIDLILKLPELVFCHTVCILLITL